MKKIYIYETLKLPVDEEVNLSFIYNNVTVYTSKEQNNDIVINVIGTIELEEYQAISEAHRYFRSEFLVIQGIISYLLDYPVTVYDVKTATTGIDRPIFEKQKGNFCLIDKEDYTEELDILLYKIKISKNLMISVLDRWRKALFLISESNEADLFYDEAFLSLFHILELLSQDKIEVLRGKLNKSIEDFLLEYYSESFFDENQRNEKLRENKKALSNLLNSNNLSFSIQIKNLFNEYDLLNDKTSHFIDNMVKLRNSIAHGRITYKNELNWPVSPFFNLSKQAYDEMDCLEMLTKIVLDKFIGIGNNTEDFKEVMNYLKPSAKKIKAFWDNPNAYKLDVNNQTLISKNNHDINWNSNFFYYLEYYNKKNFLLFENALGNFFLKTNIDDDNFEEMLPISIIFGESKEKKIQDKAKENILNIKKKDKKILKEIISIFEYYNVEIKWYKDFLSNNYFTN